MTIEQLREAINANEEAKALADKGDDYGAAKVLSASLPPIEREREPTTADLLAILLAAKLIEQSHIDGVLQPEQIPQTVTADEVSKAWAEYRPEGKVVPRGK